MIDDVNEEEEFLDIKLAVLELRLAKAAIAVARGTAMTSFPGPSYCSPQDLLVLHGEARAAHEALVEYIDRRHVDGLCDKAKGEGGAK